MSRGPADRVEFHTHSVAPREFIAVGIPTFGQVHVFWAARVFANLRHPMNRVVRHVVVLGREVGDARNEIVAQALAVEERDPMQRCSHVFFIDDDVLIHPDALLKLLSHDRAIVSGLYYAKTSVPQALLLGGEFEGTERRWAPGDLVECWAHGMGLTLIHADVFRTLRDKVGVDRNGFPAYFKTTRDSAIVTATGVPAYKNQTEDVYFLRMAAEHGYQPAVDTSNQTFGFHWAQAEQRAYPLKQWFEYQQTGRITWTDTPDGKPVVWEDVAA